MANLFDLTGKSAIITGSTKGIGKAIAHRLAEHGAKLTEGEHAAIEQALGEAREAVKGDDMERIRRAQESLKRASQTVAEAMYRESRGGTSGRPESTPQDGDVVDAEFRNVDDQKR